MYFLKILALLITLLPTWATAKQYDLLPPEQAFVLSTERKSDSIELNWQIAEGYYLYQNKFKLTLNGSAVDLDRLNLPSGIPVDDPLFGRVDIYKKSVGLTLNHPNNEAATLSIISQGCYEPLGICYPPQTQDISLASTSPKPALALQTAGGLFNSGGLFKSSDTEEFLPDDEAFKLVVTTTDTNVVTANFEAAAGYYLYKPHIKFNSASKDIILSQIDYPQGVNKDDPHFGEIEVYYGLATIPITLGRLSQSNDLILQVAYQGCAEDGICYQPQQREFNLTLSDYDGPLVKQSSPETIDDEGLFWYLLAAFGAGLLLTFTPCVLPMIPILSGIIVNQQAQSGRSRAGLLSITYVLGTAVSYSLIGAVAGASGEQLQAYFQTPLAIGLLSTILIITALSMFGLFKLQLPAGLQTRLSSHSQKLQGGRLLSVFCMGLVSALIIGACVSPLLISTLSIAIAKGSMWLGAALMFAMALGMGLALIVFGLGFGHLLPKAGAWMEQVNKFIGLLLMAVALYLFGFIPAIPVLFLWSLLLVFTGVYLFNHTGNSKLKLIVRTLAILLISWGILALIGGFNAQRDIFNPLPLTQIGEQTSNNQSQQKLFITVDSNEELDRLLSQAKSDNKKVMLDYYADWCLDCLRMEATTFKDPQVIDKLHNEFVSIKIDLTDANDNEVKAIKKRFNVYGPPATLFFDNNGRKNETLSFYGYMEREAFLQRLNQI